MIELIQVSRNLRASFWFLPTLMVLAAGAGAVLLVQVDLWAVERFGERYSRAFGITEDGARELLSSIASSMLTVAGVTFSITIVTLSLASSQYTSRVLRNFLRDRGNQMVLGVFVAVYVYCLIVQLSIIQIDLQRSFVPLLAVSGGVLLAFAGIGFLIFFIHHVAHSIQVSAIVEGAAEETLRAIDHLFPEGVGDETDESRCLLPRELTRPDRWHPVLTRSSGYIQTLDADRLLRIAEKHNVVIRMQAMVGDFVVQGTPLVSIQGAEHVEEDWIDGIHRCLVISAQRTVEEDAAFGVRQVVDVALRALSPGVNDTTTANVCLGYLTVILARMIQKPIPSPCRSTDGRLRIVIHGTTFTDLVEDCYEQIRQNAGGNARVLAQLLHSIQSIGPLTSRPERVEALQYQVQLISEVASRTIGAPADRARLLGECSRVMTRLQMWR